MSSLLSYLVRPRSLKGNKGKGGRVGAISGLVVPISKSPGPDNFFMRLQIKQRSFRSETLDSRISHPYSKGHACMQPNTLLRCCLLLHTYYDIICTKALECRAISSRERHVVYCDRLFFFFFVWLSHPVSLTRTHTHTCIDRYQVGPTTV